MKKALLIMLFVLLAVGWMAASGTATGNQAFTPTNDVLGAHNNGGRGCAGCHAPHSGGRGNGGDLVAGSGITSAGGNEGDWHLWGQDVSLITQSPTITFGVGYNCIYYGTCYTVNFGGAQQWNVSSSPLISGIAICLSCHDGNISKGAMMTGQSYEQAYSLLPDGGGAKTTNGALYGTTPIPTWLGADGGTNGDYANDHPVGQIANINYLDYPNPLSFYGLTYVPASGTWTVTGAYAQFVANYGMPSILALVTDTTGSGATPYVVCTTCHNQHQMNVYLSSSTAPIAGNAAGSYATYFFVNAPYNPGAPWGPADAPSTTQFCRQCHFGVANEAFGVNNVGTAF